MSHLYLGGSGIFGTPLGVTATFVILIVLFGAVLENSGAGKVLMEGNMSAEEVAKKAIKVAADICVFTNDNVKIEKI